MGDVRFPDYSHVPTKAPEDRAVDLNHAARVVERPSDDALLHLGAGPEATACGEPRGSRAVTDLWPVFASAKAGHLAAHPHVCDACDKATEGNGAGPYRGRG